MKITTIILAFALTGSVLPSHADPTDEGAQKTGIGYAIQFGHQTVAILPANPARTMDITCDGSTTRNVKTGVSTFSGNAKIVISEPGQTPVTITGNDLTLTPQK